MPVHAVGWTERVSVLIQDELDSLAAIDQRVSSALPLSSPGKVQAFYRSSAFTPLWSLAGQIQPQAHKLITTIRSAWREGLDPSVYRLAAIEKLVNQSNKNDAARQFARTDLLLTDVLISYADDLLKGRLSDSPLRQGEDSDPEQLDLKWLASAVSSGQLGAALSALAPRSSSYASLRRALSDYRALRQQEIEFNPLHRTLKRGDAGADVKSLRQRLMFLQDLQSNHPQENSFDGELEQAVIRFQVRHGLKIDGIAGPETYAAMAVPLALRVSQIEYNLERWRWLPRSLGRRYVVVNIAGFSLEVVEDEDLVLWMRAIVGKPFQQTPVFSSKITHLTLNPFWEVPFNIATKEMLPKVRQDPGYLQREHMRVLRVDQGKVVQIDPADVDWKNVGRANFPYRFRQDPGPANALGRVKFYLPNRYSVYLHDTPNKSLFSQAVRCFSHGCVRLERPFELTAYLLRDQPEWTRARIIETLEHEQNFVIMLSAPIPIYTVYWTAWVDSQGILNFRKDIYGRDKKLSQALSADQSSQ